MVRVAAGDVTELYDTDLDKEIIDEWIAIASELVDDIADRDSTVSDARLKAIEKLLAAHFASAQDPRIARETVGDVSLTYQGEWADGIMSTTYGQQAAMLDPTNVLTNTRKPEANVRVLDSRNIE